MLNQTVIIWVNMVRWRGNQDEREIAKAVTAHAFVMFLRVVAAELRSLLGQPVFDLASGDDARVGPVARAVECVLRGARK